MTPDHPHRELIIKALERLSWRSILEVGCGAGANLVCIRRQWPAAEIGGVDISEGAIAVAQKALPQARFLGVCPADDVFLSDKSIDVVLTDMTLIYTGPLRIRKTFRELMRVSRNNLLLCEFHHKSFWKRQGLRFRSGYHAYDYRKLLEDLGCYNIEIIKIPEESWPGGEPQRTFGCIITCSIPS